MEPGEETEKLEAREYPYQKEQETRVQQRHTARSEGSSALGQPREKETGDLNHVYLEPYHGRTFVYLTFHSAPTRERMASRA